MFKFLAAFLLLGGVLLAFSGEKVYGLASCSTSCQGCGWNYTCTETKDCSPGPGDTYPNCGNGCVNNQAQSCVEGSCTATCQRDAAGCPTGLCDVACQCGGGGVSGCTPSCKGTHNVVVDEYWPGTCAENNCVPPEYFSCSTSYSGGSALSHCQKYVNICPLITTTTDCGSTSGCYWDNCAPTPPPQTYQHKACVGTACSLVDCSPNTSPCSDTCVDNTSCIVTYKHKACVGTACSIVDCNPNTSPCADTCVDNTSCVTTTYQHKACVGSSCSLVDCSPNTSPCSDTCVDNTSCVTTSSSYYLTRGGNVTAQTSSLSDSNLPATYFIADNSTAQTDAGIVAGQTLVKPAGNYSRLGYLDGYTTTSSIDSAAMYQNFLNKALSNGGYSSVAELCDQAASLGSRINSLSGKITYWCYGSSSLDAVFRTAADDSDANAVVRVVVPYQGTKFALANANQSLNAQNLFTTTGQTAVMVAFVKGNLAVSGDQKTDGTKIRSGASFIAGGELTVASAVAQLDGLHLFPGDFSDTGSTKLTGVGSLLNLSPAVFPPSALNLTRNVNGVAEDWSYDPKYLDLLENVLARPNFTWQELPPQ